MALNIMGVTESTAVVKCHGHYKHFFKGVYYRAVKVSSRLEVLAYEFSLPLKCLLTVEIWKEKKKKNINLETMVSSGFE